MSRTIFRTGNSAVVALPSDALEAIGLSLGDKVLITADPERRRLIVTPVMSVPKVSAALLEAVDRIIEKHQPTLEALAMK